VLTKRAERMKQLLSTKLRFACKQPHIWWGVSVEDTQYGLPRIEHLRNSPAAFRFLSIEPLLEELGTFDLSKINWVIVGGESGPGARVMKEKWVERVQELCDAHGTAFFFKQWGGVQKSKSGRLLHGRTFDEMPERVVAEIPSKQIRAIASSNFEKKTAHWKSLLGPKTKLVTLEECVRCA
jgi:protein gp37